MVENILSTRKDSLPFPVMMMFFCFVCVEEREKQKRLLKLWFVSSFEVLAVFSSALRFSKDFLVRRLVTKGAPRISLDDACCSSVRPVRQKQRGQSNGAFVLFSLSKTKSSTNKLLDPFRAALCTGQPERRRLLVCPSSISISSSIDFLFWSKK